MDTKLVGQTLAAVVAASLVLCLIGGFTRRFWSGGAWAVLLAVAAVGLVADKPLLGTAPQVSTTDIVQRVIVAAVPLAAVALALSAARVPFWAGGVLAAAAAASIFYWVLSIYAAVPGDAPHRSYWLHQLVPPALASLALWALIEPLAVRRANGLAAPWVVGCLFAGVGFLGLFSLYTQTGLLAAALGAVVGGAFLATLVRGPSFARGPVAAMVPLLVCVVMVNHLNDGGINPVHLACVAAAPLLAWVVEAPPMRGWRPWRRELLRCVLVAAPVVVGVSLAFVAFKQRADESGGY